MKLSVIVPVFNQEEFIYRNLHEALKEFGKYDFEIILVNDGSTDNTVKEASLVKDKRIKIAGYSVNKGKGHALKYGFKFASGDAITFMDADLDIHPRNLVNLYPYLKTADMVLGSKRHPLSKVNYPLKRKIFSYIYHMFVNLLFGLDVKDTQSGFKLIKYNCLKKVLPKVLVKRFAFDLELVVNAKKLGFKVAEAPISLKYNFGNGSGVNFKAIRGIFIDTLAIAYRLYVMRYYDRKVEPIANGKNNRLKYNKSIKRLKSIKKIHRGE